LADGKTEYIKGMGLIRNSDSVIFYYLTLLFSRAKYCNIYTHVKDTQEQAVVSLPNTEVYRQAPFDLTIDY